jgi:hypothetical protein
MQKIFFVKNDGEEGHFSLIFVLKKFGIFRKRPDILKNNHHNVHLHTQMNLNILKYSIYAK